MQNLLALSDVSRTRSWIATPRSADPEPLDRIADGDNLVNGAAAAAGVSKTNNFVRNAAAVLVLAGTALWTSTAQSQVLAMSMDQNIGSINRDVSHDRSTSKETDMTVETSVRLRRRVVDYATAEGSGTVIIDTPNTYLYFVLGGSKAIRYGIGVGREGFTWSGVKTIERKSEWPDWIPPADMLQRQPYLPRFMAGGPGNPLGARAMYLGGTVFRIHGTNAPETIGKQVSSGCIRMVNEDVIDLYGRTHVGTKVVVLPMGHPLIAQAGYTAHTPTPATSSRLRASSLN
jgi:lipoprotein-anchoring transpeptidase ErfK/SrfK